MARRGDHANGKACGLQTGRDPAEGKARLALTVAEGLEVIGTFRKIKPRIFRHQHQITQFFGGKLLM